MSVEGILAAIRREADGELAALAAACHRELEDGRAATEAAAAAAERDAARARDSEVSAEASRRIRQAEAAAARLLRAAREEAFESARYHLRERFESFRNDPAYPGVLASLLAECRAILPAAVVVRTDPRDEMLVGALLERSCSALKVDPSLEPNSGGLELDGGDGRLVANTFEARLERAEPELRRIVAELLTDPPPAAPPESGHG